MNASSLAVYFDGLCPLCSREIDYYRKLPGASSIRWVDITEDGFDAAAEGLDPEKVHRFFHVKTIQGQVISGVDAFIEIWKAIPSLHSWYTLSRIPGARGVMKVGYSIFARVRPYLPRRRRPGADSCETGTCAGPNHGGASK